MGAPAWIGMWILEMDVHVWCAAIDKPGNKTLLQGDVLQLQVGLCTLEYYSYVMLYAPLTQTLTKLCPSS